MFLIAEFILDEDLLVFTTFSGKVAEYVDMFAL